MSHTMRCKMKCHAVTPNEHSNGELCTVTLGAVYSQDPDSEDAIYGKATPYGDFRAGIITEVAQKMIPGKNYYVDIHLAE